LKALQFLREQGFKYLKSVKGGIKGEVTRLKFQGCQPDR